MLGFLGWPTPAKHEEFTYQQANIIPAHAPAPANMTPLPSVNHMKRKRGETASLSPRLAQPLLKRTTETMSHVEIRASDLNPTATTPPAMNTVTPQQGLHRMDVALNPTTSGSDMERPDLTRRPPDVLLPGDTLPNGEQTQTLQGKRHKTKEAVTETVLRQSIESQFNLEILIKHRELRLIEQEVAKCQVALEQLRRCRIIPFPAQSSSFMDMQAVSGGAGPAYNNHAPHAPPWGIASGPYSQHYQKWLIPDSAFNDDVADDIQIPSISGKMLPDRATRGLKGEKGIPGSHARSQRGSASAQLNALPHGYREPKQEKGPMIVKRSSDGHMVKLVCLDCRRSDFNSVQGFINHCRIQHARGFVSHTAAIEASGEEIDAESESVAAAEANGPQAASSAGLVHPLIRSARPPALEPSTPLSKRKKSLPLNTHSSPNDLDPLAASPPDRSMTGGLTSYDGPSIPFKPSPQAPHLSSLLAKLGHGGDLDDMVTDAKTRPDLDLTEEDDYEDLYVDELEEPDPRSRSTRGVIHGGTRPASSNKSNSTAEASPWTEHQDEAFQAPRRVPAPSRVASYPSLHDDEFHIRDDQDHSTTYGSTPFNLSPNTTDPHPAPSLVSDDGEYDNTHSESEASSRVDEDEDEDHYVHPDLLDHDGLALGESSGLNLAHPDKSHGPPPGRRSRPSTTIHDGQEERHVSFASPVRRHRRESQRALEEK